MKLSKISVLFLCALLISTLGAGGCTPKVGGSDYAAGGAQQAYEVQFGTVHSVRMVEINDSNMNSTLGAIGGGVVGGIIGNMFGRGAGNTLATLGGVAAGAAAGGAAGQMAGNQAGVEVTVNLDNGKTIVVVQGADMSFAAGQRVRVTQGGDGKSRVSPM